MTDSNTKPRVVITYGTFDVLHHGHIKLLQRAKALGDKLIVGVTSDEYDKFRGKFNVKDSLITRIENIKELELADSIIVEEYEGQKIDDIKRYNISTFVVGSDWTGKFDYLNDYCEVIYLERTKNVSSTQVRNNFASIRLGIVGCGRVANRFVAESKFVSGVEITSVFTRNFVRAKDFANKNDIFYFTDNIHKMFDTVDAVYIASPHSTHYQYIKDSLLNNKHVICEKPIVLLRSQIDELESLALSKNLVLMEAIKTEYSSAFKRCVIIAKSGKIGRIIKVSASFSKICEQDSRELTDPECGGGMTELGTYPLLAIFSLLGFEYKTVRFTSLNNQNVDIFCDMYFHYDNAIGTGTVAVGGKTEGDLIISGTKGYIYVPAPWWKTEYFEIRFEDANQNEKYFYKFHDDGFRYELSYFIKIINDGKLHDLTMTKQIVSIMETFRSGQYTTLIV